MSEAGATPGAAAQTLNSVPAGAAGEASGQGAGGGVIGELRARFGDTCVAQTTVDGTPTVWVESTRIKEVLAFLKRDVQQPYEMLFDLSMIDERMRKHREGQPAADFTAFYHLTSLSRNSDVRIKTGLPMAANRLPSVADVYPNANWYEREAFDMFGVQFDGHPNLRRILTPPMWEGHPLLKDHPARATEL